MFSNIRCWKVKTGIPCVLPRCTFQTSVRGSGEPDVVISVFRRQSEAELAGLSGKKIRRDIYTEKVYISMWVPLENVTEH